MSSEAEPTEREGEEGWGRRSRLCVCVVGGSGSVTVSCGRGIPPREERRFGRKERKSKRLKKESRSVEKWGEKRRRNEGECCFDVKGDGRVVVGRARGRKRKVKERGLNGSVGQEDEGKTRGRGDPRQ